VSLGNNQSVAVQERKARFEVMSIDFEGRSSAVTDR
jgi:hypothetical protein